MQQTNKQTKIYQTCVTNKCNKQTNKKFARNRILAERERGK